MMKDSHTIPTVHVPTTDSSTDELLTIAERIKQMGYNLGFQDVRFSRPEVLPKLPNYLAWLEKGYHGEMSWLERNIDKRFDGRLLLEGTLTAITVRMDYHPNCEDDFAVLKSPEIGYIARYALGRDYHKVMRKRITQFGKEIEDLVGNHGHRAFVDSAPVMERQLAEQSGIGWIGKNSLLLVPGVGSWFFLGELFTNLELPIDAPKAASHCGSCNQCIVDCPTDAFIQDGVLDARKCISYLTIEFDGVIPVELRSKMGNRIYGCDDCQLVCPHNRKAPTTAETDFKPRFNLDKLNLVEAFNWDENTFLTNMEGSPVRRIGYQQWCRNIAIALGNAPHTIAIEKSLNNKLGQVSPMVDEHIRWALTNHRVTNHSASNHMRKS